VRLDRAEFFARVLESGTVTPAWPGDTSVAAFVIDIQRFSVITDVYGVAAGYSGLERYATLIEQWAAPDGIVSQIAGDVFAVLIPGVESEAEAISRAGAIRQAIGEAVVVPHTAARRDGNIGVAVGRLRDRDLGLLLREASDALRATRGVLTDPVHSFQPEMHSRSARLAELELQLPEALRTDSLEVLYQPEVDLITREVVAVEALVRWPHPMFGPVGAEDIVAVAERSRLIGDLSQWVIATACRQLTEWTAAGLTGPNEKLVMRINVSPVHLVDSRMPELLLDTVRSAGASPDSICIEVTETVEFPDIKRLDRAIHGLRAAGVQIALDDFGTGHSSLSRLTTLPVDAIKIDRTFTDSVEADEVGAAVVTTIIELAHRLKLDVIAEGVETDDAVKFLIASGCVRGQGHLFGEASPPSALRPMLTARRSPFGSPGRLRMA
jgi:diguanylate cyclase (GGDEF)-like protein